MKHRPRPPALQLYTSPAVVVERETRQVQVLVPTGWRALPLETVRAGDSGQATIVSVIIRIAPKPRFSWLPGRTSRSAGAAEHPDVVELLLGDRSCFRNVEPHTLPASTSQLSVKIAERQVKGSIGYRVRYCRASQTAFDAYYRQICDSFQILR